MGAGPTLLMSPTSDSEIDASASALTAGLWDDNANFEVFLDYLTSQKASHPNDLPVFDQTTMATARAASLQRRSFGSIDIALMLDTTGSMSDELSYLQTELSGISGAVGQRFPDADVRWSLVVYRDMGDEYVTRTFDFTADAETFRGELGAQRAGGGGDEPEAVPAALEQTLRHSWRGAEVAQMLLWVGDAPHHDVDTGVMRDAVLQARDRGIRIYPVAASSANPLAEATMRVAAQVTGGRYLFLTDDSGIGNQHREPQVPCYYVTTLNDAIVRSIAMELTGSYVDPSPDSIVRVMGRPSGATCEEVADSGEEADAGDAA
jgi:hypothetical protein